METPMKFMTSSNWMRADTAQIWLHMPANREVPR
jgi:hypothetical protein